MRQKRVWAAYVKVQTGQQILNAKSRSVYKRRLQSNQETMKNLITRLNL